MAEWLHMRSVTGGGQQEDAPSCKPPTKLPGSRQRCSRVRPLPQAAANQLHAEVPAKCLLLCFQDALADPARPAAIATTVRLPFNAARPAEKGRKSTPGCVD